MRLFLLCLVVTVFSIFAVVCVLPESNADVPQTDVSSQETARHTNIVTEKLIDVPAICQYPELPTGCESVAATMVLQYYGVDITAGGFAASWLECSTNFYRANGKLYGPNPNEVFAGSPFNKYLYGCFATPIVYAVNRNSANCTARKITGRSLEALCREYIDNDKPLLIWATMNMKESYKGSTWYLEDGSVFSWIAGEHCLVLVGYNDDDYFLNDPMTGSAGSTKQNNRKNSSVPAEVSSDISESSQSVSSQRIIIEKLDGITKLIVGLQVERSQTLGKNAFQLFWDYCDDDDVRLYPTEDHQILRTVKVTVYQGWIYHPNYRDYVKKLFEIEFSGEEAEKLETSRMVEIPVEQVREYLKPEDYSGGSYGDVDLTFEVEITTKEQGTFTGETPWGLKK